MDQTTIPSPETPDSEEHPVNASAAPPSEAADSGHVAPPPAVSVAPTTATSFDLMLGCVGLVVFLIGLPLVLLWCAGPARLVPLVIIGAAAGQLWMLAYPLWIARRRGAERPLKSPGLGRIVSNAALAVPLSIAVLLVIGLVAAGLGTNPMTRTDVLRIASASLGTPWLIALVVLAVVVAPVSEEVFFRAFLYGGLRSKLGWLPALAIQSFAFGLAHALGFAAVVGYSFLGAALTGIYAWRKTIYASIAVHACINIIGMAGLILYLYGSVLGVQIEPHEKGLVITRVVKDSSAEHAGLREGDVIRSFDGRAVSSPAQLTTLVRIYSAGDLVTIDILRDGEQLRASAVLRGRDRSTPPPVTLPEQKFVIDYQHEADGVYYHGTVSLAGHTARATWTIVRGDSRQTLSVYVVEEVFSSVWEAYDSVPDFGAGLVTGPDREVDFRSYHVVGITWVVDGEEGTRTHLIPAESASPAFKVWLEKLELPAP